MVTEETKRKTADAMASKASTKQATDDEQVIQLKKQLLVQTRRRRWGPLQRTAHIGRPRHCTGRRKQRSA